MTATRDRVHGLVDPVVTAAGYDLDDLSVTAGGRRRQVRVVVDGDAGLSLDDVAALSRALSEALDASDVMGSAPYTLEVTSPGVDRPLTQPRHWRRAATRLVQVTGADGASVVGRVLRSDDEQAVLDVDGTERTFDLAEISKAVVQVEFSRAESSASDEGEG